MMMGRNKTVGSLYAHVPFCARKCAYCAFYSEPSDGALIQRYVVALTRELELVADDLRPDLIFFGGGTPSLLNLEQWRQLGDTFERLGLLGASEWTVECNPATVSLEKAQLWRRYGINRVSMGVQSLDAGLLDRLGRVHSRAMVFKSFDLLRRAGFDNINIDLMFAVPGQTLEMWQATLREAIALGSEHLSSYELIYEEDTPLFAQLQAGKIGIDEDLSCAMYDELLAHTAGAGLVQYEIANFARHERPHGQPHPQSQPRAMSGLSGPFLPSRACRHNINYWQGGSYYGAGPSAAGYVGGVRAKNISNTSRYCERLERGERAIEWQEELAPLARAGEMLAFGLRMNCGWNSRRFRELTGYELSEAWQAEIGELTRRGWAEMDADGLRLTALGLRYADGAAELVLR